MRIREITFHDFRAFRGERHISFVDSVTDSVRPLTVLAGSNGSGKTTVLDSIEALLHFAIDPDAPNALVSEVYESGLIHLKVELSASEKNGPLGQLEFVETEGMLDIVVGQRDLAPRHPQKEWPNLCCRLVQRGTSGKPFRRTSEMAKALAKQVSIMQQGLAEIGGGLLYFPHDRRLGGVRGGAVEPPPQERQWLFRFSPSESWKGSLEQLWVWQNYLDLEKAASDRSHLAPFVKTLERILGRDRPITVSGGRVHVPPLWNRQVPRDTTVRIDQLPSGEQQVLLLFGELARRRRRGPVITIDEVENSLHPTLQRLVMWNLEQLSREWGAQVIVATHSLEVIQSVRGSAFVNLDFPENIFDLPVEGDAVEVTL